ncbi:EAL domain-containing protein [Sulfitobacter guttiformis]|uniref:EAL domain-containing protein (Putative c-di-GMP-specific phosphodiesterase class I) n=1 Tax=Sulfitobacter guttiformis TaxID=74349 RepID=A0A420DQD2_9RHOB|nr:EAL domain-containing protein [Sulfitobacter guttiformis]KIN73739.1 EAL domain protein [Sulfitobacter guttiformis KCTC 32187]RKE96373.1 EAL domain-containing protein (putative c-di-GMP-specific phosphodiesterase class I) [Sulfitobacter guttiformis]
MKGITRRKIASANGGSLSPLDFAISQGKLSTLDMVKEAIAHNQTMLAFQPVIRSDEMGQTGFYEGLIRVLDPTGRVIPAGEFMSKIEDTETGREIDVLALRHGLSSLKSNGSLRLSINMSARSIGYKPWMNCLNRFLNESPALGERLILEISENSAMLVPELVIDFIARLQPRGICFAMDNFGSGHMAIRYFRDFDFDILKIDGQFMRGISTSPDNQAVVRALFGIAQQFEMLTVAECIETTEDAMTARNIGIDCLQGYYFSAPTTRPDWAHDAANYKSA